MPWRLIGIIFVFIIFLVFIGFNLGDDYQSNINFGFKVIENVPVFFTIFVSLVLGVLVTLPASLISKKKRKDVQPPKNKKDGNKPKEDNPKVDEPVKAAEGFNEPVPSYSGGKFFKKKK